MRIRMRLVLYFLFLAIVPLTLVNVFSYYRFEHSIREQAITSAQASLQQISNNVDTYLLDLLSIARVIVLDRSITQWLRHQAAEGTEDAEQLEKSYRDELAIRYILNAQKGSRPYIQGLYLLSVESPGQISILAGTDNDLNPELMVRQSWWKNAMQASRQVFIAPHEADYYRSNVTAGQSINLLYPISYQGSSREWVMIRMTANVLLKEFETGIGFPGEKVGMTDGSGKVLLGHEDVSQSPDDVLKIERKINVTGWMMIGQIPHDQLFQPSRNVRNFIVTVTVAASVLGLALAFALSLHVLKPLRSLRNVIRSNMRGSFRNRVPVRGKDEIGDLSLSYNQMLDTLDSLMKRVAEEESAKKEAELKALQYQINPHFLYNTLNTVQWMAVMNGVPKIKELVAALIRLLQSSLGKKGQFQTLEEEIEDVKNYMSIQQFRFGDDLAVFYETDAVTLTCMVPRLILQPLVENAIFHGFEDGKGNIWIETKRQENTLLISIIDDGIGMTEEQIKRLMTEGKEFTGKFSGIGIQNVSQKINRLYGKPFGIHIISEIGQGTKLIISLPVQEESPNVESHYR